MAKPKWTCLKCCEIVDDEYDVCWICGTNRDGFVDPDFETADDSGPIRDPLADRPRVVVADSLDELPAPVPDLVQVFYSQDLVTVRHVVQQLRQEGIPALVGAGPSVYFTNEVVLVRVDDEPRALDWVQKFLAKRSRRSPAE